jgi:hypothetical protein
MTDTRDAILHAMSGNAKQFGDAINDIMTHKVRDALDLKKIEVANQFMSADVEDNEVEYEVDAEGEPDVD